MIKRGHKKENEEFLPLSLSVRTLCHSSGRTEGSSKSSLSTPMPTSGFGAFLESWLEDVRGRESGQLTTDQVVFQILFFPKLPATLQFSGSSASCCVCFLSRMYRCIQCERRGGVCFLHVVRTRKDFIFMQCNLTLLKISFQKLYCFAFQFIFIVYLDDFIFYSLFVLRIVMISWACIYLFQLITAILFEAQLVPSQLVGALFSWLLCPSNMTPIVFDSILDFPLSS